MNVTIKDIDLDSEKPVTLVPLSDVHVGHVDFDEEYFKNTVAWIKEKGAYTMLLGDLIDGINPRDRRYENKSIDPRFYPHLDNLHHAQVKHFLELIKPITGTGQIIGVMGGNHENTVLKSYTYDAVETMAEALDVPIMTDPGYTILRFHQGPAVCTTKIWASHGCFMGGRLLGSKVNSLKAVARYFRDADIYLAGHTHDRWVVSEHRVGLSNGLKIKNSRCYFANTGAFLRTYREGNNSTWASTRVFSPQIPECVRFDFYLKRKDGVRYMDIHSRV